MVEVPAEEFLAGWDVAASRLFVSAAALLDARAGMTAAVRIGIRRTGIAATVLGTVMAVRRAGSRALPAGVSLALDGNGAAAARYLALVAQGRPVDFNDREPRYAVERPVVIAPEDARAFASPTVNVSESGCCVRWTGPAPRVVGPGLGTEIVLTNAHKHEVFRMDASLDGSTLATRGLSGDEPVRIWRLPHLEQIAELPHADKVLDIKLSDDGKLLAFFTGPGDVGVWEIPSMKGPPMWQGVPAVQNLTACAFSPDNRWLAAAVGDGGAYLWELATHRLTMLPRALTRYVSFSFSPDGSRLATAGSALWFWGVQ